jgi:adenine phosphoribosyltransferase
MTAWPQSWTAHLGDVAVELPLVEMPNGSHIYAFDLMGRTIWNQVAATMLAERIRATDIDFDMFLTAEAKAIALNQSLAELLGHAEYIVARKSLKVYMKDPIELSVKSITTDAPQKFFLGKDRYELLRGKTVCVIDDVVSTGGTMGAFLDLSQRVGFDIVLIACVLTEGVERTEFEGIPLISLDHIPFPGQTAEMP